jgi:hypothetical protein
MWSGPAGGRDGIDSTKVCRRASRVAVLCLAMALAFDPHLLVLSWSAGRSETLAATSLATCTQASMTAAILPARPLDRVSGPPALGVVADTAEWSGRRHCAARRHTRLTHRAPRSRAEIRLCCPGWRIGCRRVHQSPRGTDQSRPAGERPGRTHAAGRSPKAGHGAHPPRCAMPAAALTEATN